MCFVLTANGEWAFSAAADQTVRVKVRRDRLLGQSCIDAICHSRLTPVGADSSPLLLLQPGLATGAGDSLLSPAAYRNPPIFSPIRSPIPLKHMSTMPIYSMHSSKSTGAAELKRWQTEGVGGLGWRRGSERKRLRDWNGYSGWNLGIKWTVGGECKTENKKRGSDSRVPGEE